MMQAVPVDEDCTRTETYSVGRANDESDDIDDEDDDDDACVIDGAGDDSDDSDAEVATDVLCGPVCDVNPDAGTCVSRYFSSRPPKLPTSCIHAAVRAIPVEALLFSMLGAQWVGELEAIV
jgi:hypothetical protein